MNKNNDPIKENKEEKLPPLSRLALRTIAMPADTNAYGDMFGGWILSQMDMAGGNTAALYAGGRTVTVAIDAMTFLQPVAVGDEVSCYAEVIRVGRTSITIQIQTWARQRTSEVARKVTEGTFTFVAIDKDGKPTKLTHLGLSSS
jgi:acyl-CoA thioesterase YciA